MKYDVLPLFSTPLMAFETNLSNPETISKVSNIPSYDRSIDDDSWLTVEKNLLFREEFKEIKQEIDKCVNFYKNDCLSILDEFSMIASWAVKHGRGDYSGIHIHSNSAISGVLYLNVDDDSGDILFNNLPALQLYTRINYNYKNSNVFNSIQWRMKPKNGHLYLFPSSLPHHVEKSKSDMERLIIAFNYFPTKFSDQLSTASIDFRSVA